MPQQFNVFVMIQTPRGSNEFEETPMLLSPNDLELDQTPHLWKIRLGLTVGRLHRPTRMLLLGENSNLKACREHRQCL